MHIKNIHRIEFHIVTIFHWNMWKSHLCGPYASRTRKRCCFKIETSGSLGKEHYIKPRSWFHLYFPTPRNMECHHHTTQTFLN